MKKLFGLYFLVYIVSIVIVLMSCQKPTVSSPEDIAAQKVFIKIDAYNADGTVNSSTITIVE